MMKNIQAAICSLAVLFWMAPFCLSQEVTGVIAGTVTDPSGGVVSGATVTVQNKANNEKRTATSGGDGVYTLPLLRPGSYTLTATAPGFKTAELGGITLELNQRANVPVQMTVGQITDRVEVQEQFDPISTQDEAVGKVIDGKSIEKIPLNGRVNIVGLMALAPGIQNAGTQDGLPTFGITPTVAGASTTGAVAFSLDGITNSTAWIERGMGEWPPLDGIQEFKVITSGASAEFGKANQVVVVTKSGTNQYHGMLIEINRNRVMAAKNFFATQLPNPQYNRNEFGGYFAGPVSIPKIYNGKDRTFFFFNYEGFRRRQAGTRSSQVPTTAMRAGDFRGLTPVIDPLTGSAFPNNMIPASRQNAVTRQLTDIFYPLPNLPGAGPAGTGINLTENISNPEDADRISYRLDHRLTSKDQLSFSNMIGKLGPNPSIGTTSRFGGMAGIGDHNYNYALSWNRVISSTLLLESRIGYYRIRFFRTPQNYQLDPSTFIPGLPPQDIGGAPQVNIQNITGISEAGSRDLNQSIQAVENLTFIRGKHTVKAGFTYQLARTWNLASRSPQRGQYVFTGRYTGNGFADFYLGYPNTTQKPDPSAFNNRFVQYRYQFFVQDDWRVTPKLTVNVGLRYELQDIRPQTAGNAALFVPSLGRVVVFGDQYPKNAIPALVQAFKVPLSKDVGLPTDMMSYLGQDTNNFAPRIGFAYRLDKVTVLRSAIGLYYNVLNLNYTEQAANQVPFGTVGLYEQPAGAVPGFTMNNPFGGAGSISPNPDAVLLNPPVTPYNIQWNVTLERAWKGAFGTRLSYVGQRNVKSLGNPNLNAVLPAPGPAQPRRPYQPFANITLVNAPIFQSGAHQLQAGIQRRYTGGLLITAEYQYVRAIGTETYMSPANYNDSRGNLGGIRKHVLASSYVYDIPFGHGKRFFQGAHGLAEGVIGGWQLSGIVQALSGAPFSPSFTTPVQGSVGGRPNVVLGVPVYPADQSIAHWFNPLAFSVPADFTYGNAGYNQLWGPRQFTWDASVVKSMRLLERATLEMRMDAFSVLNHPTFSNPSADITNPGTVGRISSAGGNRTVQLGAKLTF